MSIIEASMVLSWARRIVCDRAHYLFGETFVLLVVLNLYLFLKRKPFLWVRQYPMTGGSWALYLPHVPRRAHTPAQVESTIFTARTITSIPLSGSLQSLQEPRE